MADMKVVFFTNIDAELRQVVAEKALPGMDVVTAPADMDDDEKVDLVRDADFIMLFPGKISDRVLQAAHKCKLIQEQEKLGFLLTCSVDLADKGRTCVR